VYLPSFARTFPSFPSVPSSPHCSLLQARYNAARRRPSCIFKRAVLLCSRYHSHHLDRPLDDRSPPSPTSQLSPSLRLLFVPSFSLSLSSLGETFLLVCTRCTLPSSYTHSRRYLSPVVACAAVSTVSAPPSLSLFSVHYDAIKNFSGGYVRVFERFYAESPDSDGRIL